MQTVAFQRLAWLSLCLAILTDVAQEANVHCFPSYNAANALVAIFVSLQDEADNLDLLLRCNAVCGIIGVLTTLADIAFCIIWAGDINGYSGVTKISFIAFILNIFTKVAIIYSAMAMSVAASSQSPTNSKENNDDEDVDEEQTMKPKQLLLTPKRSEALTLRRTPEPQHYQHAHTPGGDSITDRHDGIPGLISPGFDPRNSRV